MNTEIVSEFGRIKDALRRALKSGPIHYTTIGAYKAAEAELDGAKIDRGVARDILKQLKAEGFLAGHFRDVGSWRVNSPE